MSTTKNEHNPDDDGPEEMENIAHIDTKFVCRCGNRSFGMHEPMCPLGKADTTGSGREGGTPTPETDANALESRKYVGKGADFVSLEFARQLERQRDAALAQVEALRRDGERLDWLEKTCIHSLDWDNGEGPANSMTTATFVRSLWLGGVQFDPDTGKISKDLEPPTTLRAAIDSAQRQEAE